MTTLIDREELLVVRLAMIERHLRYPTSDMAWARRAAWADVKAISRVVVWALPKQTYEEALISRVESLITNIEGMVGDGGHD